MSEAQVMATGLPQPTKFYRWMVLIFVSLAMFGNYYVYDCIAPVADLLSRQLGFSDSNIGLLQGIYSVPNVFMVLIGGVIVDRIGTRKSIFIFGVLCMIGAIIPAYPDAIGKVLPLSTLWIMALGRLIFGLGAESLIVAVTTAIAKWFKGKELSFAFGINLMIARFGSLLAQNSPSWAHGAYSNWRSPLVISVFFGTMCIVGPIIYWGLEARAERSYSLGAPSTDKVVFKDLFGFGISYWYIVALCIVFYSAIFPFETFAYKFFIDVHHTTREASGFLVGMLTFFTMIGTPLFGLFADKIGKRALLMMFGSVILIPVYLMMAYIQSPNQIMLHIPFLGSFDVPLILLITMGMMGIAFALIPAVMWPSVAYIVPEAKLGTAYGLMTMIQNIGLAGFNFLIGWENDLGHAGPTNPSGYHLGMWTFSILGFLGLTFAFLLRSRETGPHGHGLETITTATASK
jgi:MFS family permease